MPKIFFAKTGKFIEVLPGANLMQSLLAHNIPVASSCHGDAVCGKCRIDVLGGIDQLSKPNSDELRLREQYKLSSAQRIGCQTSVLGDIRVDTPYW